MKKSLLIVIVAVIAGCSSQPRLEELINDMVVLTSYDTNANFGSYTTYTMPLDTIGLQSNQSTQTYLASEYAHQITQAINRNLTASGRQRVEKNQTPSLGINIFVVNNLEIYQSVMYPSYGGYPGYGYGYGSYYGYGGYYGYPQVVTQQFDQAILVIELADLAVLDPTSKRPRIVWSANIGDLINSYDQNAKVIEAIDQAFAQSTYLKR